jgi:hypothetical protein
MRTKWALVFFVVLAAAIASAQTMTQFQISQRRVQG